MVCRREVWFCIIRAESSIHIQVFIFADYLVYLSYCRNLTSTHKLRIPFLRIYTFIFWILHPLAFYNTQITIM